MTTPMKRAFLVFLATMVIGLGAAGWVVWNAWRYPDVAAGPARGEVELEIPRGAAAGEVASRLEKAGLIARPTLFRLYTAQRGAAARIRPGTYRFQTPVTPKQIVDTLLKGVADPLVALTIPEGKNVVEVAELIAAAGIAPRDEFLAQAFNPGFVRSLGLPGLTLEGYLYPDTYKLRPKTPPADVAVHLVRRHRQVWEEIRRANADGLARLQKSLAFDDHKVVILASIVEKETSRADERPRIAQVFLNRLTKPTFRPKLLQTDPTIIYGCAVAPLHLGRTSAACKGWDGDIKRVHLNDPDNEYSTYANEGLPPGPIANPGRASLAAVLKPDGTPYLYFVARGDGSGRHVFSSTLAEHEANVVRHQRGGRPMPK